ncbi:MAG: hypothetical protein ACYCVZ_08670, partial [Streptosporangiaceae bacterium]
MEQDAGRDRSGDEAAWLDLVARFELPISVDPASGPWPDRENLGPVPDPVAAPDPESGGTEPGGTEPGGPDYTGPGTLGQEPAGPGPEPLRQQGPGPAESATAESGPA